MVKPRHYLYNADALSGQAQVRSLGHMTSVNGQPLTETDMSAWIVGYIAQQTGRPADTVIIGTLMWTDIPSGPDTGADTEAGQ